MNLLLQQVQQLLTKNPNERILKFEFEGKKYWLKQPEKLSLLWRFLKSEPQKSLQKEIRTLRDLNHYQAPVPAMPLYGENFLVLEDSGESVSHYLAKLDDDKQKLAILLDCAASLFQFHQRGLIHGRPVVRDVLWQQGKICFIDFENYRAKLPTDRLKIRDMLIFIYSLCREESLSDELLVTFLQEYQQRVPQIFWDGIRRQVAFARCLYFLLLLFKPIAKKDLRAVYRLFEAFSRFKP